MTVEQSVAVLTDQVRRLTDQADRMERLIGELREQSAGGPFVQVGIYESHMGQITSSLDRVWKQLDRLDVSATDNRERKLAVADFNVWKDAWEKQQSELAVARERREVERQITARSNRRWVITSLLTAISTSATTIGIVASMGNH